MKSLIKIGFVILFSLPVFCFSQNGIQKLKDLSNALSPSQDTSKSTGTGTSNLAVSDPGSSADKSKQNSSRTTENPMDKLKKKLTENAVQNNNTSGTGTQSNLAVSDPGSSADKPSKGKNNRETGTSGTTDSTSKQKDTPAPASTATVVPVPKK